MTNRITTRSRSVADKVVVITGAASGMGRATAFLFADEGAKVAVTDLSQERVDAVVDRIRTAGGTAHGIVLDVTDADAIIAAVEEIRAELGPIDVVVNNAAIYPSSFLLDMEVADWDHIMGINVRAPFVLMRGFAVQMIENGVRGNFVNISSGAARKMRRTAVTYCMSKTALDRMTKGFALELAEYGIRANCLEPGFATGSAVSTLNQEHINRVLAAIPLGNEIDPEDVGQAALYLASSAAKNITGTSLSVDGGNSAGTLDVYQDKKSAL